MQICLIFSLLTFLAGCQTGGMGGPASSQPLKPTTQPVQMAVFAHAQKSEDPRDPQPELRAMVHLDIYFLDLPPASVASNKNFWKRVDEEAVGVASHDLLAKNGLRSGIVPRTEAAYFGNFFNTLPHPPLRRSRVEGLHESTTKLEMENAFDREDLFIFSEGQQQAQGKSYEHGTNNLMLTFGPTPRDPSAVRVTVCPVVHNERHRLQFTAGNQEFLTTENDTDRIYDLSLTADIPEDSFFIIAPSADAARRTTSVGGCFLIKSDATQRREQVIVIVPTFLRVDGKPMLVRDPLMKP